MLRKASIDARVMKPLVATTGMKEGYLNEEYVVKALPECLRSSNIRFARKSTAGEFYQENELYGRTNSEGLNVKVLQTVELVCMKGNEHLEIVWMPFVFLLTMQAIAIDLLLKLKP